MHSDSKKCRSFVALLFAAGDVRRYMKKTIILTLATLSANILMAGEPSKITETNDNLALFNKLITWQVVSCPKDSVSNCFCVEFTPKNDSIPMQYIYIRHCPSVPSLNDPQVGVWNITQFNNNWGKVGEGQWLNGDLHGKWSSWYNNNVKATEGSFKQGQPIGIHSTWSKDGIKTKEHSYDNTE